MPDDPVGQSALAELVDDPASRKKFLKTVGTGGAASLAVLLAACGSKKKSSSGSTASTKTQATGGGMAGDLKILNYALTLEYLEAAFYKKAIASGKVTMKAAVEAAKKFGDTEQQHVDTLEATIKKLGGKPAAKPKVKFPLKDEKSILKLAATVENLGAAAYLGAAGSIENKEILAAALSIHSVEARHAAALNFLLGMDPVVDGTAFAKPASMQEVLPMVQPFIVG